MPEANHKSLLGKMLRFGRLAPALTSVLALGVGYRAAAPINAAAPALPAQPAPDPIADVSYSQPGDNAGGDTQSVQ